MTTEDPASVPRARTRRSAPPAPASGGPPPIEGEVEVLLVHRPRYDDWSLPKGKLDPGEHPLVCAVREVEEETGHRVVLGRPLPRQRYTVSGRPKVVQYWVARADDRAAEWGGTAEIDQHRWVPTWQAPRRTHPPARRRDRPRARRRPAHDRAARRPAPLRGGAAEVLAATRPRTAARRRVRRRRSGSRTCWPPSGCHGS